MKHTGWNSNMRTFVIAGAMALSACQTSDHTSSSVGVEQQALGALPALNKQYVVLLKPGEYRDNVAATIAEINRLKAVHGIPSEKVMYIYDAFGGFAIKDASTELAAALASEASVVSVAVNALVHGDSPVPPPGPPPPPATGQVTPAGVTRVNGGTTTSSATLWVIDSGVDLANPDLNVSTSKSISFVQSNDACGEATSPTSADDFEGHGTRMAGLAAAIDNTIGVVGVAPGSQVVSVRALNQNACGTFAAVIAAANHVRKNAAPNDVVNMSVWGTSLGGALVGGHANTAVAWAAVSAGVYISICAGNAADDAKLYSPGSANGVRVYTIAASTASDGFATLYSNWGVPPIDYIAPGYAMEGLVNDSSGSATIGGYGTSNSAAIISGMLLIQHSFATSALIADTHGNTYTLPSL